MRPEALKSRFLCRYYFDCFDHAIKYILDTLNSFHFMLIILSFPSINKRPVVFLRPRALKARMSKAERHRLKLKKEEVDILVQKLRYYISFHIISTSLKESLKQGFSRPINNHLR